MGKPKEIKRERQFIARLDDKTKSLQSLDRLMESNKKEVKINKYDSMSWERLRKAIIGFIRTNTRLRTLLINKSFEVENLKRRIEIMENESPRHKAYNNRLIECFDCGKRAIQSKRKRVWNRNFWSLVNGRIIVIDLDEGIEHSFICDECIKERGL